MDAPAIPEIEDHPNTQYPFFPAEPSQARVAILVRDATNYRLIESAVVNLDLVPSTVAEVPAHAKPSQPL